MISEAIIGTYALGYVKKKGLEIATEQGKTFFTNTVKKLKEKFVGKIPADNKQLESAHRRACLIAMKHICDSRRMNIGETGTTALNKLQDKLYGEQPFSLLSQPEKEWTIKAEKYIEEQIFDELSRGT
ncbi:MAG TPA: hypothetical protein VNI60_01585 [Pyrinomonadaceae bacterium]|nr:hypothetical protein [Pyrinomonadaceae bacterium]